MQAVITSCTGVKWTLTIFYREQGKKEKHVFWYSTTLENTFTQPDSILFFLSSNI